MLHYIDHIDQIDCLYLDVDTVAYMYIVETAHFQLMVEVSLQALWLSELLGVTLKSGELVYSKGVLIFRLGLTCKDEKLFFQK